jgi:RNA polymerase sigma-70 factor (ECF subfamily)
MVDAVGWFERSGADPDAPDRSRVHPRNAGSRRLPATLENRFCGNLEAARTLQRAMTHPLVQPRGQWMTDLLSDAEVVRRVLGGEAELFELLVRRHNQRLFRTVRAMLKNDDDAEEAVQLAHVSAWRRLSTFDGRSEYATWITQIALRSGWQIARAHRRRRDLADAASADLRVRGELEPPIDESEEIAALLERAIAALPRSHRVVFVLRVVEGLATAEVARDLGLGESAVKVRLHRARERLRKDLLARAEAAGVLRRAWSIGGERCDRIVARVFAAIRSLPRSA